MKLTGKIALVTGAAKGIGRSIAIELAKAGASVIINYNKSELEAEKLVNEIRDSGLYAVKHKCDISNYNDVTKMIKDIKNKFGKIDILVNNAGISSIGLFIDSEEEQWDNIINTNLKGVYNTCHNVSKIMLNQMSGVIINISSIWGNVGASCEVIYSASKGGINAFSKALGKELAPSSIRVNAVAPGVIDTDMNRGISNEDRELLISEIPMNRMGSGDEVGKLVVFLCSDEAKYITSQVITIDGGYI